MSRRSPAIRASSWSRPRADRARASRQTFTDWRELIRSVEGLEAVAITTPPGPRYEIARECILAGLHCLLEKPPTAGPRRDRRPRLPRPGAAGHACSPPGTRSIMRRSTPPPRRSPASASSRMDDPLARGRPQMASGPAMDLGAGRLRRVRSRHQRLLDRDQDLPRRPVRAVRRAQRARRMRRRRSPPRSSSPARRPTGR